MVEDVAFYVAEARKALGRAGGGPVVELGVGTGRIAIPIAQAGVPVIGVDSSAGMLEVCRARAGGRRRRSCSTCARATCATRRSTERVPLVACPFRAYLHLETDADRRAALAAAHRLLLPGRPPRFDVFTPAPDDIAETQRPLDRARARDLGARRLGRGGAPPHAERPRTTSAPRR